MQQCQLTYIWGWCVEKSQKFMVSAGDGRSLNLENAQKGIYEVLLLELEYRQWNEMALETNLEDQDSLKQSLTIIVTQQ